MDEDLLNDLDPRCLSGKNPLCLTRQSHIHCDCGEPILHLDDDLPPMWCEDCEKIRCGVRLHLAPAIRSSLSRAGEDFGVSTSGESYQNVDYTRMSKGSLAWEQRPNGFFRMGSDEKSEGGEADDISVLADNVHR